MAHLTDFMLSKVRVELLEIFFQEPQEMWYVRELTRRIGEEINAVRRELDRMTLNGLLTTENRGNRKYYALSKDYEFYPELIHLVSKTTGMGAKIRKNRKKLGKVKFVCFSEKFIRKETMIRDDVAVLVVGDIVLPELAEIVREEEKTRGSEINYTVMSEDEFMFRKSRRDPFLLGILEQPLLMVIGDILDLFKVKPGL